MTRLKTFARGGVKPPSFKEETRLQPISNAPIPSLAVIPMRQHAGEPADCIVKPGEAVREGMLIGRAKGESSANVHASIPGRVADVGTVSVASGESSTAAFIELEGEFDRSGRSRSPIVWEGLSAPELIQRIKAAGVVGLGGSRLPSHAKLASAQGKGVSAFIADGVESEPFLSADHRLMLEKSREVAEGMRIVQRILAAKRAVLAVSEDSQDAAPIFERIFRDLGGEYSVEVLAARYPQGEESRLAAVLQAPGAFVLNVATIHAIWEAVTLDKPLIERIVTVAGPAVVRPRNLKVRLGTPAGELFDECGGLIQGYASIVLGGPMTGRAQSSFAVPITKDVGAVLAFAGRDAHRRTLPCIRCGACIDACPWGLAPTRLYGLVERGDCRGAAREGLLACTECGCCAYACPSAMPLVEGLRRGKLMAARV
jgi:electron transport complex protein RnfC